MDWVMAKVTVKKDWAISRPPTSTSLTLFLSCFWNLCWLLFLYSAMSRPTKKSVDKYVLEKKPWTQATKKSGDIGAYSEEPSYLSSRPWYYQFCTVKDKSGPYLVPWIHILMLFVTNPYAGSWGTGGSIKWSTDGYTMRPSWDPLLAESSTANSGYADT